MTVQMNAGPLPGPRRADHAHRGYRLVSEPRSSHDLLDIKMMPRELSAEKPRTRFVLVARRIDCGNPDEIARELNNLVSGAIDFAHDAIDGVHGVGPTISQESGSSRTLRTVVR